MKRRGRSSGASTLGARGEFMFAAVAGGDMFSAPLTVDTGDDSPEAGVTIWYLKF